MKNILFILFSLFLLHSCEKEIDLDLEDESGNIVIEGNITNESGPYVVRITKSVGFTQPNQYPVIAGAQVSVSDNTGQSETLVYMGNGKYQSSVLTGVPGRTYTLKVVAEGKEYTAKSTMPAPVNLEGLVQDSFDFGGQTNYTLLPVFTDPSLLGNRYLFSFTVNSSQNKLFEVFSDNVNNGIPNQRPLFLPNDQDDAQYPAVVAGDTIYVEMNCIDSSIFTYYNALLDILYGEGSGAGVTPSNPPSNITNGALGYFSAHTVSKKNVVIQ